MSMSILFFVLVEETRVTEDYLAPSLPPKKECHHRVSSMLLVLTDFDGDSETCG